jgi:hypothetical protein
VGRRKITTTYKHPRVCLGHVQFACLGLNERSVKGWGGLGLAVARSGVAWRHKSIYESVYTMRMEYDDW